jgi:hypothetical protein
MIDELIEPVHVEDDYCTGIAFVEDLGGCARFVLYSQQFAYEANRAPLYVVRRKIVLPNEAIGPGIEMAAGYIARRTVGRVAKLVRR